jgi:predicted Zn finger-like uncharacterized protein
MKTRCPHCKVIYNIRSSTLEKADYKVVCSECHHVFSVKGKQRSDKSKKKQAPTIETGIDTDIDLTPDAEMQDLLEELQQSLDKQNHKQAGKISAGNEEGEADSNTQPDTVFSEPLEVDSSAPTPDAIEIEDEPFAPELSQRGKPTSWLALLSLAILLLTALIQLAWVERERLLQFPRLHAVATRLCSHVGCTLPRVKAPSSFAVVDRSLETDPARPGSYRLDILLRNTGTEAQVLPSLQLSLLDDKQIVVARRTFPAATYAAETRQPLDAGELIEIHLLLLPAEEHISGFELNFIPSES